MSDSRANAPSLSVVIPTYNRLTLLIRAIKSVVSQQRSDVEIIVVDDCSADSPESMLRTRYPCVRYLCLPKNSGPGPARDYGIVHARAPWVLTLDDDDELRCNAIENILTTIRQFEGVSAYPLVQFPRTNGGIPTDFKILSLDDYLADRLWGDFTHIFQRTKYLAEGLSFPATRLGAENILLWQIARRFGVPTWNRQVTTIHDDAPDRLTAFSQQVKKAGEFAVLQEMILEVFGDELERDYKRMFCRRHMGAAAYWVLAGNRKAASQHLQVVWNKRAVREAAVLYLALKLPTWLVRTAFLTYRNLSHWFGQRNQNATSTIRSTLSNDLAIPESHLERAA